MRTSIDQQIELRIERTRSLIHPQNNIIVNQKMETEIRMLQITPRTLDAVSAEITIKKRKIALISNSFEREPYYHELEALEWLERFLKRAEYREVMEDTVV